MKRLFITIFITLISFTAFSQKVALVLSGGGAKGLAHIGVLKYLEEHNIPIDYIAGTSMGAVVGGFYAAGYSPEEIESIALSKDFQNWINGITGENYNSHYFRRSPDAGMLTVSLGVDQSMNARFNPSFGNDAVINFVLAKYLAGASAKAGNNFDSLFIPFRSMASEIFTQSQVVIDSGNLQEAVRASIAVPFLFRPVRFNNQLLFDGGLYNNFPVDVALKIFKPDVAIGINVVNAVFDRYPYEKDEELISNSLLINLLNKGDPSILREQDIYIKPDLEGLQATDFNKASQMLDSGFAAAERKYPDLMAKIPRRISRESLEEKRRTFHLHESRLMFKSIQFRGFNGNQMYFMRNVFKVHKKSVHSIDDIERGYFKLISNEFFKEIFPRINYNRIDSTFILELVNKYDRGLKFDVGGFLTTRNIGELYLGARFNSFNRTLTEYQLQFYTGSFYQSFRFSSRINFPTENFIFIKPELLYNNWDFIEISDLLKTDQPKNKYAKEEDLKAGLEIGWPAGSKYKMVINGNYIYNSDRYSNYNQFNSSDTLDKTIFEGYKSGISISRNSLNRKQYPDRGSGMDLRINYYYGEEDYSPGSTSLNPAVNDKIHEWVRLNFNIEHYFRISSVLTGGWSFNAVLSNQPFLSNYSSTILNIPAFYPLNDSRMLVLDDFRAINFGAAGLRTIYKITDRVNVRAEGYIFKPLNHIAEDIEQKPYLNDPDRKFKTAASLTGIYNSPIGPISLGLNYYSTPNIGLGIFFHLGYLLFNERSFD